MRSALTKVGAAMAVASSAAMIGVMLPGTAQAYYGDKECSDWKPVSRNLSAKVCQEIIPDPAVQGTYRVQVTVLAWNKDGPTTARGNWVVADRNQNLLFTPVPFGPASAGLGVTQLVSAITADQTRNDVQTCALVEDLREVTAKWICTSNANTQPKLY